MTPDLGRIFASARDVKGKRPLVIIPGILGSELVNKKTGEVVWPAVFHAPTGDQFDLQVSSPVDSLREDIEPRRIIDTLKLSRLIPEVFIYHELLTALKDYGGYTEGDWNNPGSDGGEDKFYVFPYDWRRDNVENARLLIRRLEDLKRKLGRSDLRVNIVAHSMGGLIARYAAEYGDTDLPEDGKQPIPTWAGARDINKILMVGTPNEGSADAFESLIDGYSITEGLRRRVRILNSLGREDAFAAPSLFQPLPHSAAVSFLDSDLKPLSIDLYDPAVWRKYGWSAVNDPEFRARYTEGKIKNMKKGAVEDLDGYLAAALHRARRFDEALDAQLEGVQPVTLLAFGGDCEETLNAPLIIHDETHDRWLTFTLPRSIRGSAGRLFSKKEVTAAMYSPGDGRVTRRSLLAETLISRNSDSKFVSAGLPFAYAVFVCDLHSQLQNNKNLQDNALTALVAEAIK